MYIAPDTEKSVICTIHFFFSFSLQMNCSYLELLTPKSTRRLRLDENCKLKAVSSLFCGAKFNIPIRPSLCDSATDSTWLVFIRPL